MQSPATISPSSFANPSAPRAPRANNRKSGINAIQNNTQQSQSRRNDSRSASKNDENKATRQSLPPQQRDVSNGSDKTDMSNVSILKRSSALPGSKPSAASNARNVNTDAAVHKQPQPQQRQQQQHRNHYSNQKPRPQSQQQTSKARRVQRRKEIESDLDMTHQSPPLNPSSPPSSSSDSDDSESTLSRSPNHFLTKGSRQVNAVPQRPSSAPVVPQVRHGRQQAQGYTAAHAVEAMQRPSTAIAKASSADRVHLADRVVVEKKNGLYAGPTFHNSPAPTSLPIPAFALLAGNSPVEPSVEQHPSPAPFFAEAASPQLNSMRPQPVQSSPQHWHAHHSMPAFGYNIPDHMATSSFVPHETGKGVDQLMEISQNLRMLLKIQSQ
ncbi:hypothetical protein BGX28_001367 [Mortierella sp. GBA30]|nr:hypothetical protein BGX28_001367 [Mortierella sp. GBA30]